MSSLAARRPVLSTDHRIIFRDIGSLLLMQAVMMCVSAIVALAFREFYPAATTNAAAG